MFYVTHILFIISFIVLAASPLRAQSATATQRVVMTGQVSGVAAVALGSTARLTDADVQVSSSSSGGSGLFISLAGTRDGETTFDLPIQLRSNTEFALNASGACISAQLASLSVVEVSGAGPFVYAGAVERVRLMPAFEGRADFSSPFTILTAPPISMGGTLTSQGNMIEVVLRVVVVARDGEQGWRAELKLAPTGLQGRD